MPPSPSRPKAKNRILAERLGLRGEALAAFFLQLKFYRIRDRRYRTPSGEIDIVAQRGDTIVFVEVKVRKNRAGEYAALEAVNTRRISRAADHWLARHPRDAAMNQRFDIIFLAPGGWPRHLINAFDAG